MYETTNSTLHYIGHNHDFEDWAREVVYRVNTLLFQKIENPIIQRFNFYLEYINEKAEYELHQQLNDNPNHVPTGKLTSQELDTIEPYYVLRFEYQDSNIDPNITSFKKGIGISDLTIKSYFNGYFYNKGYTKADSVTKASYYCFNTISAWLEKYWSN